MNSKTSHIFSTHKTDHSAMYSSITEHSSDPNKSSFHWRNNSGELDVFEAARYFSAASNDQINGLNFSQKVIQDVQRPQARRSLDMPMRSNPTNPDQYHHHHHHDHLMILDHQKPTKEIKKCKQPSSPGGRLATFLNSLFNQTHLKKKKKSKSGKNDFEDEIPGGRRKRRSSISHFRITGNILTASDDKKSLPGSGFRTPPVYANTPTKSCQESRKFPVHEISSHGRNFKITLLDELHAEKNGRDRAWIDDRFRIKNGVSEKTMKNGNLGFSDKNWDPLPDQKNESRKIMSEEDDGADSDSSSDLFDLPNHELDFFSSGLPVYETTHMGKIKIAESSCL